MISVLCIGQYEKEGRFTTIQWEYFLEWCKTECNRLIVYSRMHYDVICTSFPLWCNIQELESPDVALDIHAYEINVADTVFWTYIKDYDYNIDNKNDISHIFFFSEKRYIASLETVDYENYVLIKEPVSHKGTLLPEKELLSENIQFCNEGKSDIDGLLQGESWKPLGV